MDQEINIVIKKHFSELPRKIARMTSGICNEVYLVKLKNNSVIVRIHKLDRFLRGSSRNIPIFKSKGIVVPEILFEDYLMQTIPYAYQIMTVIEGEDLGKVIHNLKLEQLPPIAKEVSGVFLKLEDFPMLSGLNYWNCI